MKPAVVFRLLMACPLVSSAPAMAQTCEFREITQTQRVMMPLQAAITVQQDTPLGTVLYHSGHSAQIPGYIRCGGGMGESTWRLEYEDDPGAQVPGYPGHYPTDIPGVSIRWWRINLTVPGIQSSDVLGASYLQRAIPPLLMFSLVKTGPVSPGTLSGSTLPRVRMRVTWGGATALDAYVAEAQGQLSIVSGTCNVADMTVPLGSPGTAEFTGPGSAGTWVDFSIGLSGCPAFFGARRSFHTANAGTNERLGEALANVVRYRLDPSTPILDPTASIMALSNADDAGTAQGVGIQVALPDGAANGFGGYRSSGLALNATPGGSYRIPLRARYRQTADRVRPGRADGQMVVTLRYE